MTANSTSQAQDQDQSTASSSGHNLHGRAARTATVERITAETQVTCTVNLDGTGQGTVDTGVPFLDHMIDQIKRHGLLIWRLSAPAILSLTITIVLKIRVLLLAKPLLKR